MKTRHLSKFLSLVLRHKPEEIGLQLDQQGWASTQELLEKLQQRGLQVDIDKLREVVRTNDKQRFKFSEDESKIRANQGHSIAIDLDLQAQKPPVMLYHGTALRNKTSILEKGLIKGSRQHVHLSNNKETAIKVGQRHGKPIVLVVDTQRMETDGFEFFLSDNGVWLTDHVPPEYIH